MTYNSEKKFADLLYVKVAAFILVELVVFPLGCGIMLDVCTISLFPQGSFQARVDFLIYAPLTSAFYHWVVGTMFMYVCGPLVYLDSSKLFIISSGINSPYC